MKTKERFIMNKRILVAAMTVTVLGVTGCSSTGNPTSNTAVESISDQRLAVSDFKRQGIRIGYTLGGDVEFIETTGYAPVWGSSQNAAREAFRVAELEAKKSLNDFINKESITSSVSVRMVSQNLENARDNKKNSFASNRTGSDELVALDTAPGTAPNQNQETTQENNTATRTDALQVISRVNTTITTQNRGILGGLYLVEGRVINDGKNVQVVYRWDRKSNAKRQQLRTLMSQ
jgi:hypothetical protein